MLENKIKGFLRKHLKKTNLPFKTLTIVIKTVSCIYNKIFIIK